MVSEVLSGKSSLSAACRQAGVTRKTGKKWVERAKEQGVEGLCEMSRAPREVPGKTEAAVERALLSLRARYPEWGARKLVVLLRREQGLRLPSRTADHILSRNGLTAARPTPPEPQRFERQECGAMLQMDFKGLPRSAPYSLLSVLDDHGRFCLAFEPLPDKTSQSVRSFLWGLFAEHGLPASMLMDNGDCWGSFSRFPTAFELWLMLLGTRPLHGRPGQTQGKVERFHGTARLEMGARLAQPSLALARPVCRQFVDRYNWVRPHDALGGQVPGSTYRPFPRRRPDRLPRHEIPEGATSRKVDAGGFLSYRGQSYRLGRGLVGQRLLSQEDELGDRLLFAGFPLLYLHEI